ncbi:MAG: hypothetical protein GKS03_01530 [Alphaproteobacteria bacterium]|nr:hypothetical protein [Alphaproteobacteria bacterium]
MTAPNNPAGPPDALLAALKRMLRPLVRLMITKGVTLPTLTNLLKETFVSVAEEDFPVSGKRQTDSRINLLTGVHRKDVKRLREEQPPKRAMPQAVGLGAQIVSRWVSDTLTTDSEGRPIPLPRQGKSPGDPSFDGLVEGISKDVRPRAVLDEWLRLGVASIDENDWIVLNRQAFVPEKGFDEKAFYFGRNIHDHLAATAHNLIGDGNPRLERSVHYGGLTESSVNSLAEEAEKVGMDALLTLNRLARERVDADKGKDTADQRFNFGLYFFDEDHSLDDQQGNDSD